MYQIKDYALKLTFYMTILASVGKQCFQFHMKLPFPCFYQYSNIEERYYMCLNLGNVVTSNVLLCENVALSILPWPRVALSICLPWPRVTLIS